MFPSEGLFPWLHFQTYCIQMKGGGDKTSPWGKTTSHVFITTELISFGFLFHFFPSRLTSLFVIFNFNFEEEMQNGWDLALNRVTHFAVTRLKSRKNIYRAKGKKNNCGFTHTFSVVLLNALHLLPIHLSEIVANSTLLDVMRFKLILFFHLSRMTTSAHCIFVWADISFLFNMTKRKNKLIKHYDYLFYLCILLLRHCNLYSFSPLRDYKQMYSFTHSFNHSFNQSFIQCWCYVRMPVVFYI